LEYGFRGVDLRGKRGEIGVLGLRERW